MSQTSHQDVMVLTIARVQPLIMIILDRYRHNRLVSPFCRVFAPADCLYRHICHVSSWIEWKCTSFCWFGQEFTNVILQECTWRDYDSGDMKTLHSESDHNTMTRITKCSLLLAMRDHCFTYVTGVKIHTFQLWEWAPVDHENADNLLYPLSD